MKAQGTQLLRDDKQRSPQRGGAVSSRRREALAQRNDCIMMKSSEKEIFVFLEICFVMYAPLLFFIMLAASFKIKVKAS
ncbi:hypothetical protein CHN50_02080 [Priestia aryabhattai]|nr:hypothetical protein CHN50_02080 [Priestia aryabhattai]